MRGILWSWLLGMGAVFWASLCTVDYRRQKDERFRSMASFNSPPPMPKIIVPPTLTTPSNAPFSFFTLCKCFVAMTAVAGLGYLRHFFTLRKQTSSSQPQEGSLVKGVISWKRPTTRIDSNLLNTTIKREQIPEPLLEMKARNSANLMAKVTAKRNQMQQQSLVRPKVDVKQVQMKLEQLQRKVTMLRQSHVSGLVSGSPAFKRFLGAYDKTPVN